MCAWALGSKEWGPLSPAPFLPPSRPQRLPEVLSACRRRGRKSWVRLDRVSRPLMVTPGEAGSCVDGRLIFLGQNTAQGMCGSAPSGVRGLLGGLWGSYRSLPALAIPWGTAGELLAVGVSATCSGPSCQPGRKAAPLPGQWVRLAG